MMAAPFAILLHLDPVGVVLLILLGRIVAALAVGARQRNHRTHEFSSYPNLALSLCDT
jgi:formate hydrogenlyase subunit 3/multisubunit Na+/H+ antiporter MnhD subunit